MQEIWKSVVGYDGYLEVSSMGRIRSVERTVTRKNGVMFLIKSKVLTPQKDKKGYLRVRTSIDGKKFTLKVHRVVAEAFLENPDNKQQVDHIDGNKENNIVENLRVVLAGFLHIKTISGNMLIQKWRHEWKEKVKVLVSFGRNNLRNEFLYFVLLAG